MTAPAGARSPAAPRPPAPADAIAAWAESAPIWTATAGRTDSCRLTVDGPRGRADLAVPATATIAELLPVLLRHLVAEDDREHAWVLQRLGGPPLDLGMTAETAELHHGDVLYLRPDKHAMPAMQFDDVAVGAASVIAARSGRWRPSYTARLLRALACMPLTGLVFGVFTMHIGARIPVLLGAAALTLGLASVLAAHVLADGGGAVISGLAAIALAALAGLSAVHGLAGVLAPGRREVLLAGLCAASVSGALLADVLATQLRLNLVQHHDSGAPQRVMAGPMPLAPYGAALATAVAAVSGSALALATRWDAAQATAALAVAIFVVSSRTLRLALRAGPLRIPFMPGTSEELQHDIEPEQEDSLARRAARAVAYLDSLTISGCLVFSVAFIQMVRAPQWIGWTLTLVFAAAVLLRGRVMTGVWQRLSLVGAGMLGVVLVLVTLAASASTAVRAAITATLLTLVLALLTTGGRPQPLRPRPIWGHVADLLEIWTALALVPLLLQFLHVYAYLRNLTG